MTHELLVSESSCNVTAGAAEEHGRQLSQWLDMARTSQWMCDVTIRYLVTT